MRGSMLTLPRFQRHRSHLLSGLRQWFWLWTKFLRGSTHGHLYIMMFVFGLLISTANQFLRPRTPDYWIWSMALIWAPFTSFHALLAEHGNLTSARTWPGSLGGLSALAGLVAILVVALFVWVDYPSFPVFTLCLLGIACVLGSLTMYSSFVLIGIAVLASFSGLAQVHPGISAVTINWGAGLAIVVFGIYAFLSLRSEWLSDYQVRRIPNGRPVKNQLAANEYTGARTTAANTARTDINTTRNAARILRLETTGTQSARITYRVWVAVAAIYFAGAAYISYRAGQQPDIRHINPELFMAALFMTTLNLIGGVTNLSTLLVPRGRLLPFSRRLLASGLWRAHLARTAALTGVAATCILAGWLLVLGWRHPSLLLIQFLLCTVTASLPVICTLQALLLTAASAVQRSNPLAGPSASSQSLGYSATRLAFVTAGMVVAMLLSAAVLLSGLQVGIVIVVATVCVLELSLAWWIRRYFRAHDLRVR